MDGPGKSDRSILPAKRPNKAGRSVAEAVEGRGLAKGNTGQQNAPRTQCRVDGAHSALDRVREAAKPALRRQNPRQEPSALDALAGI